MINQRTLGRTGLNVSELCLGTMNFGWTTDAHNSFAILDAYHGAGGNFIQSMGRSRAPGLASTSTTFSEEIVGRWWRSRGIPRDELVLATRISLGRPPAGIPLAQFALDCCRESLVRLQASHLDLLVLEWTGSFTPVREALGVFDSIIQSGLARYVVAASFPAWRVTEAIALAREYNHCRMEALQEDYSLMTRARFEPEAMTLCQEQRLGFLARAPLADGFLAYSKKPGERLPVFRRDWISRGFGARYGETGLAAVSEVASRYEASAAQIALAWVLHNPRVTSAVIGVHTPAQLEDLLGANRLAFSADDLAQLAEATAAEEVQVASPRRSRARAETLEVV
jgi:aryl-alcohol dehydrogenase-like predicted oxidoreductase